MKPVITRNKAPRPAHAVCYRVLSWNGDWERMMLPNRRIGDDIYENWMPEAPATNSILVQLHASVAFKLVDYSGIRVLVKT
jgi:hypothetical protein